MVPQFARFVPLVLALAAASAQEASAQERAALTLETVLERGQHLVTPPPRVLWHPEGRTGALVVTARDGSQSMARIDGDGRMTGGVTSAAEVLLAIGAAGDATPRRDWHFPPCSWLSEDTLRIEHGNAVHHWRVGSRKARRALEWPESTAHAAAPGDGHVAYVRDHELWLADRDKTIRRLTHDGSDDIVYGGAAHRAEFGITTGLFWSPNGRYLAFSREDQRGIAPYPYQTLGEQPAPRHGRYPMAGDAHAKVTIGVCDTSTGATAWLESDPAEDVYWTNVAVRDDGAVYVARVNRGQDHAELTRYDGTTGERVAILLREFDAEWIEPEHPPEFLPDGRFLWWSRRDGYRHLWLFAEDGALLHQVTKGELDVQRLLGIGDGSLWFEAAGEDPRQLHVFAARLDGSGVRRLTPQPGTHRASLSADRRAAHVTWSDFDTPPETFFLSLETGEAGARTKQEQPLTGLALPEQRFFTVQAQDGSRLHGHVMLPPDLKEGERRPVLLYVYGGPHVQLVKDEWLGGAAVWLHALAAEGYVVCRLDNRGTPNRGIEFEQQVFRRLGTIEVDDQLRAVAWLKEQPFTDPDRIAVHGWSYGGYMTLRLMLLSPETFACGISGAPVTDWAMYETGYTERYMDTPAENAGGYEVSSCLPLAGKLARPLLLVHGTDDRTVMWSHTLEFVDRCVRAGTELTYFPYPMQQHGLRGQARKHFLRMMRGFLAHHLEPDSGR